MTLFPATHFRLEIVNELGSTNQVLLDRYEASDFHGSALMARRQSAGVGRRGRNWESMEGNLALSIAMVLQKSCPISLLPFLAGICVYDSIAEFLSDSSVLSLKWPNDIYLNKKKLGGMLSQAKQQADEIHFVLGIGLNILNAPKATRVPAVALSSATNVPLPAEALAKAIIQRVERALQLYSSAEQLCADWQVRCGHLNQEIYYFSPDETEKKHKALAINISPQGELLVRELGSGFEKYLSGEEVSLELLL